MLLYASTYCCPFLVIVYTFLVLPFFCCFSLVKKPFCSRLLSSGYSVPCLSFTLNNASTCFFILYPHIGLVCVSLNIWISNKFLVMR